MLRVVFPSISLSDEEIINVAMKSRELITSHLDATTVNAPYIYRNYSKSFAKPTSEIVISRSFQGADKSELIGPNDVQYVARDQVSGDSGRIIITSMDNGFVLKQLEVDPGYMGLGVIDKLILNAVMEHGPLRDITKITGKEKASLGMTLQKYPEIFGDTKVSMATRGFPRSIDAESPPGAEITMPLLNYTQHDRGPGNVWVKQSPRATNSNRTLLVQISTNLINKVVDPASKAYYDSLYESGSRPYDRLYDFWEIPQWIAMASKSLPNADVYVVRDINETVRFLNSAKYSNVAFSVLDVNKDIIHGIADGYKGKISVGGYTDIAAVFKDQPHVKTYALMKNFIEDSGHQFIEGTDYRHFEGAEVIPRLNLSDGCLHKCTFCAVVPHGKVLQYSEVSVRNQVESIKKLNARLAYINDKTFGQAENSKKLTEIYQELKASNPRFEGFIIQTTAAQFRTFSPEFLRDSGIKYVELGVESYNDSILRQYRKPATEKVIDEAVQKIRDAQLNLIPNIIIGMPEETAQTYARTMDFLKRNVDIISHTNDYNLAVYKGTDLADTIGPVTETDMDENAAAKSYHQNPELHQAFSRELFNFSLNQLNNYVPKGSPSIPLANFTTFMDPQLAEDAVFTAKKVGVRPDQLSYVGKQEMIDEYMHLWNVIDPTSKLNGSTRSGKVYPNSKDNLGMPRIEMPSGDGAIPGATPVDESETGNDGSFRLWVEARKGRNRTLETRFRRIWDYTNISGNSHTG